MLTPKLGLLHLQDLSDRPKVVPGMKSFLYYQWDSLTRRWYTYHKCLLYQLHSPKSLKLLLKACLHSLSLANLHKYSNFHTSLSIVLTLFHTYQLF